MKRLEYHMIDRFFRDFPASTAHYSTINQYLFTHFPTPSTFPKALDFLDILYNVATQFRSESLCQNMRVTWSKVRLNLVSSVPPYALLDVPPYHRVRIAPLFLHLYYGIPISY